MAGTSKSFKTQLQEKTEEIRDHLQDGARKLGKGTRREAKGVERRIKDGIQSSIEESKHRDQRTGRPPGVLRRPPSGQPPTGRPPSIRH